MLDELLQYAEGLGLSEVEEKYNERWLYNIGVQGQTIFTPQNTGILTDN